MSDETSTDKVAILIDAIKELEVEAEDSKYRPREGKTYCNLFVADVAKKVGAPLPLWQDFDEDARIDDFLDANEMVQWLAGDYEHRGTRPAEQGPDQDWKEFRPAKAVRAARKGHLVVAGWINPAPGGHGHVAIVRPESESGNLKKIRIAQAGEYNAEDMPLTAGFGMDVGPPKEIRFFVHGWRAKRREGERQPL